MSLHLNGWRRLWVAIAAFYTLTFVVFVSLRFPRMDDIQQSYALTEKLSEEHRRLLTTGSGQEVEFPNGHILKLKIDAVNKNGLLDETLIESVAKSYTGIINDELAERRKKFSLSAFVLWLAPLCLLYAFGEAVAWVRKGFKDSALK